MSEVLLTVTLFGSAEAGGKQLCNAAMVKAAPTHSIAAVTRCLCRWAQVQPAHVVLTHNGAQLPPDATVADCGLRSGSPILAYLAAESAPPAASAVAAPFTMVDVMDSELAAAMGGL